MPTEARKRKSTAPSESGAAQTKPAKKQKKQKQKLTAKPSWAQRGQAWLQGWFDQVDNSTLIIFRIMWGLIMAYECYTFIRRDYNKLESYYMRSTFYPKYYGFFWVHAWPGDGMYYMIWTMLVAGLGVAAGAAYRLSCSLFFLGFMHLILLDACLYLNHFYLIAVMAFMLIFLPANRRFAIDSLLFPSMHSSTMPRWIIYLLRGEQVLVYFFAGVAKCNEDWLRGEPIRHWIPHRAMQSYNPNSLFSWAITKFLVSELGVFFVSIGGLLFDLGAGFLLCFPRGPVFYFALANCVFFHITNKLLMNIGIFPWVMLASTTLFFEPDWIFNIPGVSALINRAKEVRFQGKLDWRKKLVVALFILFAVHQIVTPLRHHLYYDDVAWNEMGHRYSWRMKLRDKTCDVNLTARDPTTDRMFNIDFASHLYGKQVRKIKPRPSLMIQFANHMADRYEAKTNVRPEIYVDLVCDLNYRGKQRMFREDVDMASVDPYDWSRFSEFIYPLAPLTTAQKQDTFWHLDKLTELITDPMYSKFGELPTN